MKAIIFDCFGVLVNSAEWPARINSELLDYARQLKSTYKLAILSNAGAGVPQSLLPPGRLAMFDAVVVSAEVGRQKPEPEIFKLTAKRLGVTVNECVFVDDMAPYVRAARALGMRAILYRDINQLKLDLARILAQK